MSAQEQCIQNLIVGLTALRSKVDKVERHIVDSLELLDTEDDLRGREQESDDAHKALCEALKEIRRGKWIIKGRNEDGTCYHIREQAWDTAWYAAQCFDTKFEADIAINEIRRTSSMWRRGQGSLQSEQIA